MIQRNHTTLREAIALDGWPTVDDVRGKYIFILNTGQDSCLQGLRAADSIRPPSEALLFSRNQYDGLNQLEDCIFFEDSGQTAKDNVDAGYMNRQNYKSPHDIVTYGMQLINTDYPETLLADLQSLKKQQGSDSLVTEGAICNSKIVQEDSPRYDECSKY
jgi:hypothetical protein